jgi:hypothetical protein
MATQQGYTPPFDVYCKCSDGRKHPASFGTWLNAIRWAQAHLAATGHSCECRDDNFDHVFTVEA